MAAQIVTGLTFALNLGAKRGRSAERLGDRGRFLVRQIAQDTVSFGGLDLREYTNWYLEGE